MPQTNLNTLKTAIKTIFDDANTTTGSPIDLSLNLNTRVLKVLKTHIDFIPQQNVQYPFVSVYIQNKDVELTGMARDQVTAKRMATIGVKIAGAYRAPTINTVGVDAASENCELLMENIEEILRSNPKLGGNCDWSQPLAVNYFQSIMDNQGFVRVGILDLKVKVFY